MKNRETGNTVETRRGEIEIVANTDHVRVGVVRINDGVSVAVICKNVASHKKAEKAQKNFLNQFCAFCAFSWLNFLLLPPGLFARA